MKTGLKGIYMCLWMLRIQSSKKKEILDIVELKKGVVRVNKNLFKSSKTVRND